MNENVNQLITSIRAGDAVATEQAFAAAMAEKLSAKIDDLRMATAQSMFAQMQPAVEEPVAEELDQGSEDQNQEQV